MTENDHSTRADSPLKSWPQPVVNPMQSDRLYNVTQLISPPPEETLRRVSRQMSSTPPLPTESASSSTKRKRHRHTSSLQQVQTPNPKPRKQAKQFVAPESPTKLSLQISELSIAPKGAKDLTLAVPDIPKTETSLLLGVGDTRSTRTRRSVTPIPPYDPPSVVFTPPREVMMTPTMSKSSKRKSKSKTHSRPAAIRIIPIKKELPDIDLSAPMPPPSPTDDPILLSGPPPSPHATTSHAVVSASTQTDQRDVFPAMGPGLSSDRLDSEGGTYYDWRGHTRPVVSSSLESDDIMGLHPSDADVTPVDLPVFNLNDLPPSSDVWSDSDDDPLHDPGIAQGPVEEGEGEYTGRWRTLLVKTKQDPPSSVTRVRMEQWGRPISPFPEEAKSIQLLDDDDADHLLVTENMEQLSEQDYQDALEEEEVRRISVDPEVEHSIFGNSNEIPLDPEESRSYRPSNTLVGPLFNPNAPPEPDLHLGVVDSETEENHSANSLEVTLVERADSGEGSLARSSNTAIDSYAVNDLDLMGGEYNGSSDGESEESFIRITSTDPRAAARAAAILKQHDYDCFTQMSKSKRRRSRLGKISCIGTDTGTTLVKQGVIQGRITKTKAKRRSSAGTGVIGGQVFISGIPVTTLGSLLKEAEAEVSFSSTPQPSTKNKNAYETPLSLRPDVFDSSILHTLTRQGGGRWTKDDWKILDSCFTDERVAVSKKLQGIEDGLANVEDLDLNNVVQRYIDFLGGGNVIKYFGRDWDREFILQRARALRRKQRSGNIAPPTTPLPSHSVSFDVRLTPDLDVPDFTPLRERLAFGRVTREVLSSPTNPISISQNPQEDNSEYRKLPASLLAPRYMHLLEEATAIDTEQSSSRSPAEAPDPKGQEDPHFESLKVHPSTVTPTLRGRVKGLLYSYLPSLSKFTSHTARETTHAPQRHGLPLPPPDILEKPRGPVITPVRPPLPKVKHPKELVQLHPAPLPAPKSSMIPRLVQPRRLVDLNPVPSKPREVAPTVKPRRSSGSVKDLVESFEELRKANGDNEEEKRPVWRP